MPRIITANYDTALQSLLDASNNPLSTINDRAQSLQPRVYYQEQPILLLTLTANNQPIDMSQFASFVASIDNDFDPSTPVMVETQNSGINQTGDWDGETADLTQGQISVRLDAFTTQVQTNLGDEETVPNSQFELKGFDSNGVLCFVERFPFDVYNLQDQGAAAPPSIPAQFIMLVQAGQTMYWFQGTWWYYFPDDNSWRCKILTLQGGVPAEGWSAPRPDLGGHP